MAKPTKTTLKQRLQKRFNLFISRRIPPARLVTLDQKRIFIFPSRVGFFFGLLLMLMLVAAINYQNNMSFALTFLLATVFVIAVLHTFANLSGLKIHAIRAQPAFAGQQTEFEIMLERSRKREHYAIRCSWPGSGLGVVDLVDADTQHLQLHLPVGERGWFHPGRLSIRTTYPLGLLRCWSWVDLDLRALVYPRPVPCAEPAGLDSSGGDEVAVATPGSDDFEGFRDYRAGDSLRQAHWKGLAKGQNLQTKQYGAYARRSLNLDWDMFPGMGTEQRLSHLCYWALQFDARGDDYGLSMPGVQLPPGRGDKHRDAVLRALALYGLGEGEREA